MPVFFPGGFIVSKSGSTTYRSQGIVSLDPVSSSSCLYLSLAAPALLLVACSSSPSLPMDRSKPLVENLEMARQHMKVPGAAIGIYRGKRVLVEQGFGVADVESGRPVTPATSFRTASVAKLVLGAAALRLQQRGSLDLDDPVSKYLPDVPDGDIATLRMLGDNSAGYRNLIGLEHMKEKFDRNPEQAWTRAQLLALSFQEGPHFSPPGSGWMYSNTNFIILASAMEKAAGKSWAQIATREVFDPLGMQHSSVQEVSPPNLARGYQYGTEEGPIRWKGQGSVLHDVTSDSTSKWGAAGMLTTNLKDMRKFAEAFFRGTLLNEASRKEQRRFRDTGYPVDYRYGFALSAYEDTEGHNGFIPGYQACVAYHRSSDTIIIVLTNLYSSPNWEEPANYLFFTAMRWLTGKNYQPRL